MILKNKDIRKCAACSKGFTIESPAPGTRAGRNGKVSITPGAVLKRAPVVAESFSKTAVKE